MFTDHHLTSTSVVDLDMNPDIWSSLFSFLHQERVAVLSRTSRALRFLGVPHLLRLGVNINSSTFCSFRLFMAADARARYPLFTKLILGHDFDPMERSSPEVEAILEVLGSAEALEDLSLIGCDRLLVDDTGALAALRDLPRLRRLTLSLLANGTLEPTLSALKSHRLTYIDMTEVSFMTFSPLRLLAPYRNSLEEIHLHGPGTDALNTALCLPPFHKVRTVIWRGMSCSHVVSALMFHFPNLRNLVAIPRFAPYPDVADPEEQVQCRTHNITTRAGEHLRPALDRLEGHVVPLYMLALRTMVENLTVLYVSTENHQLLSDVVATSPPKLLDVELNIYSSNASDDVDAVLATARSLGGSITRLRIKSSNHVHDGAMRAHDLTVRTHSLCIKRTRLNLPCYSRRIEWLQ